jgi:hypothetical protein
MIELETARQEQVARPRPTFLDGMRGIWLFTWKSQLGWRRVPLLLLGLLALPVLVYLTIPSAVAWSQRHSVLGDPSRALSEFYRRLARTGVQLQPEQQIQLQRIFSEEFARAESELPATRSAETSAARQREAIKTCFERIHGRVQTILDERQFGQFETFEKRIVPLMQGRVRPTWGRAEPFYHWLIDFYFFVILPLQCVRSCGGLIRDELQADTLGFLVTRPLSRARLVVLKYLAQTTWLEILLLIETALIFAAGGLREIPALGSLLPLFLGTQFLAVLAWSALGIFFGQVTKRYMALMLLYGLIVEMGIGRIPTNINTLSLITHLKTLLSHNAAVQSVYDWTSKGVPLSVTALMLATGVFLTLAALLFTFLEYHHTTEMQK